MNVPKNNKKKYIIYKDIKKLPIRKNIAVIIFQKIHISLIIINKFQKILMGKKIKCTFSSHCN